MQLPSPRISLPYRRSLASFLLLTLVLTACGGATVTPDGGVPGDGEATTAPTDAVAPSEAAAAAGLCASDYFPVVVGATWTYSGTGITGDFTWTSTITEVKETGFTLTNDFDELSATQQWSCTAQGLAALQYGGGPEATLSATGLSGTFETTDTTGVSFPTHITAGDTWMQSFTIHGEMQIGEDQTGTADGTVTQSYVAEGMETITVPAGTFDAMKVQSTIAFAMQISFEGVTVPMAFASDTLNWWGAGVGWLKADSSTTIEGGESITALSELQSFSIP